LNLVKLCLAIHSLQPGGMERVMSELANYFSQKPNTEVHLVLYGIKRDIFYELSEKVIIHKPTFIFNDKNRLWYTFKTIWFLREKIKELAPTSVLSFGEVWNNFVLLSCKGLPFPIYVSDRCQPDKPLSQLHEKLRKWLYPGASGIIVQTERAKEIYSNLYQHPNIKVIGNPIRDILPNPAIKKENIVLSVGRLIKSKHHDELIKLFVRLNKPDWKLIIVGDDAQKQQNKVHLQTLIDKLSVSERVILAGKRSDVEDFYCKSKIFAFTSSSEGFPNVIGEAMSAGLPVVAFDCVAGPSDMISDGENGFLVPLFDYATFEGRLKILMDTEHLREQLGNEASKAIKQFSIDKIGQQFEEILLPEKEKILY